MLSLCELLFSCLLQKLVWGLAALIPVERTKRHNSSSLAAHTEITNVAQQTEGWGRRWQWCCVTTSTMKKKHQRVGRFACLASNITSLHRKCSASVREHDKLRIFSRPLCHFHKPSLQDAEIQTAFHQLLIHSHVVVNSAQPHFVPEVTEALLGASLCSLTTLPAIDLCQSWPMSHVYWQEIKDNPSKSVFCNTLPFSWKTWIFLE